MMYHLPELIMFESIYLIVSIHGLNEFELPLPPVNFNTICPE